MKLIHPFIGALATLILLLPIAPLSAAEDIHRVVIHVDDNDPRRMNMALNNASNVNKYYADKGEEVEIEIVAYGPGLHMLLAGSSPVSKRIASFEQNFDNVSFKACGNTHRKMSRKAGKEIALLPQAEMVPSGVIQLIQRQEEGWSYVRP